MLLIIGLLSNFSSCKEGKTFSVVIMQFKFFIDYPDWEIVMSVILLFCKSIDVKNGRQKFVFENCNDVI